MAKVKIEEIIDHLDTDIRKGLSDAVSRTIPDAEFNDRELFRHFIRAVGRKCSTWESVPDQYVEAD
jgi:hypothetical protein